MPDPQAIVNKLLADPGPEHYVDWLGKKADVGKLEDIRFGAHIHTTDPEVLQDNARDSGIDVDTKEVSEQLERDYALLEANMLGILRMLDFHVSDEGHGSTWERVASVWLKPSEKQVEWAKKIVEADGDWPSTTSGTFWPFFPGSEPMLYANISDLGRQLIDVAVEFTGTEALAEWLKLNLAESADDLDAPAQHYIDALKSTPQTPKALDEISRQDDVLSKYHAHHDDPYVDFDSYAVRGRRNGPEYDYYGWKFFVTYPDSAINDDIPDEEKPQLRPENLGYSLSFLLNDARGGWEDGSIVPPEILPACIADFKEFAHHLKLTTGIDVFRFLRIAPDGKVSDIMPDELKEAIPDADEPDLDDPEAFVRSYMPRMMGRVFIDFDVIKPHFPDAPANWVRDKVNGIDVFRYNRVTEMRHILQQMKADHRQRGANVPVDVVTYRYRLNNPQGSSIVRQWLDKIGCPVPVIQWVCETNAPIWFFVAAKEFNAYMQMVYPQVKLESVESEGDLDAPEQYVKRLQAEVMCEFCGRTARVDAEGRTHPTDAIQLNRTISLPKYGGRSEWEVGPNDPSTITHFVEKNIYFCNNCRKDFASDLFPFVESSEGEPETYIRQLHRLDDLLHELTNYGLAHNRIEPWGKWVVVNGFAYWAVDREGNVLPPEFFREQLEKFCKDMGVTIHNAQVEGGQGSHIFFKLAIPKNQLDKDSWSWYARHYDDTDFPERAQDLDTEHKEWLVKESVDPDADIDPKEYLLSTPKDIKDYEPVRSREEAEQKAMANYEAHVGKFITVPYVLGMDEHDDTKEVWGDIVVKVLDTSREDILRVHDGDPGASMYLDPVWNVEVTSGPPELEGTRSHYIDATSYKIPLIPDDDRMRRLHLEAATPAVPVPEPDPDDPEDVVRSHEKGLVVPELNRLGFKAGTKDKELLAIFYNEENVPRYWYKGYEAPDGTMHAAYFFFFGGQSPEVHANVYNYRAKAWFNDNDAPPPTVHPQSHAAMSAFIRDVDKMMERNAAENLPPEQERESVQKIASHYSDWYWQALRDWPVLRMDPHADAQGNIPGRIGPGRPA